MRATTLATTVMLLAGPALAWGQAAQAQATLTPLGEARTRVEYHNWSYYNAETNQGGCKLHMYQNSLSASIPIHQTAQDEWLFNARVNITDVDTSAWLCDAGDRFPHNPLWDVRLGATYRHQFDNNISAGIDFGLGSASDRPFASLDEYIADFSAHVRLPQGEHIDWLIFLNYSNHRSFWRHIPIPGVALAFRPSETLHGMVGVPLNSIYWEPIARLSLEGFYAMPRRVHAKIGYRILDPLQIYAGYDWSNDSWYRHDRDEVEERLFYYDQRVMAGVRWDILEQVWVDLAGGFAFERFFYEGEDYGDRGNSRIDVADGPFVMLQVGARF